MLLKYLQYKQPTLPCAGALCQNLALTTVFIDLVGIELRCIFINKLLKLYKLLNKISKNAKTCIYQTGKILHFYTISQTHKSNG